MKKGLLLVASIIATVVVFGQNNTLKNSDRLSETSEPPSALSEGTEKVSDYYQFEKKLLMWTVGSTIPTSVPKHKSSQTRPEYAETILYWAKNNVDLIEEKYKIKFTDETQFQSLLKRIKESK